MQIPISLSQVSRDCLIISNIDDVNLLSVLLCLCNNQQRHVALCVATNTVIPQTKMYCQ